MNKTCIIVFCHCDDDDKLKILEKTISQLKKLELCIILSTHVPLPERLHREVDFVVYDNNNPIFGEDDFYNLELPITEANYNIQYFFGGISTRSYLRKKTYQASVINHFILSTNFAFSSGFEYSLITEYDYTYPEKNIIELKEIVSAVENGKHDGFFVPCSMSGIKTIYPIPMIIPLHEFILYSGNRTIKKPEDYVLISKFKICEEWARGFFDLLKNPQVMDFYQYVDRFGDSHQNLKFAGDSDPIYGKINSGVYVNRDDENNWIVSMFNGTEKDLNYFIEIRLLNELIFSKTQSFPPGSWFLNRIAQDHVKTVLNSKSNFEVLEKISFGEKIHEFSYKITGDNFNSLKKAKWYFNC